MTRWFSLSTTSPRYPLLAERTRQAAAQGPTHLCEQAGYTDAATQAHVQCMAGHDGLFARMGAEAWYQDLLLTGTHSQQVVPGASSPCCALGLAWVACLHLSGGQNQQGQASRAIERFHATATALQMYSVAGPPQNIALFSQQCQA